MGKVRVYELAKELGMTNKELVIKLQEMGYPVKSHSSTIEDFLVKDIRERLLGKKAAPAVETSSRPTVILRRKKVVAPVEPELVEEEAPAEEVLEEAPPAEPETPADVLAPAETLAEVSLESIPAPTFQAEPVLESEAETAPPVEEPALVAEAPAEPGQAEAVPVPPELKLAKPKHKKGPKIRRIEKTTAEPARIIARPVGPEPPKPKPAPPPEPPAPPRPEPRARISVEVEPEPVIPALESKKAKKRKKGREAALVETEGDWKQGLRRREIIERADLYDQAVWDRPVRARKAARQAKKIKKTEITVPKAIKRRIKVVEAITVADLAKKMGVKSGDIIRQLMVMGVMANVNQSLDYDTAALVATEFGYEVEKGAFDEEEVLQVVKFEEEEKKLRSPVVTVMGHVDHGKTSLLDSIRKTNVIGGEAGGITQHIGAYHVKVDERSITFLDTPGHEAFTSMRARGAQVTDLVVLVIAADDGVMQQTKEAADHAKAAGVPIIVAVNKVDKPEANPERIRREASDLGLVPEEWGGDTIFVDVSAKTRQGVDDLLDMILLQAEVLELKAPHTGRAYGRIVEARLDKGRGPVATVLIQGGRLRQGDPYVCGVYHGKVRAMFDDKGNRVIEAGPSMPIEIQGITGVPQAGDEFISVEDDKQAKQVSQYRLLKQRESELIKTSKLTLENLFESIKDDRVKELNLVLKADVQGSLEAISDALHKLATDQIKVHLIHASIGSITESDIMLASASHALVVGFNVRPNTKVQDLADQEGIQIRFYDVIYRLIDEIKDAMTGLLEPIHQERVLGRAQVMLAYHISKVGTIAGSAVVDGKILRGAKVRLLRDDVVIYDGRISSLKRFKEDAKEVLTGYECGIGLENYNDIKEGDVIEAYTIEEIAATLG
ncbi:MAG: translation initiation factor IF-2 [Thermodesulfobacteriota bacterium]